MTCFRSWFNSTSPAEARGWLEAGKESFLTHMDNLTWAVLHIVLETPQEPDDWAEALRMVNSDPAEQMEPDQIDEMDSHPLTKTETETLENWAEEAATSPA